MEFHEELKKDLSYLRQNVEQMNRQWDVTNQAEPTNGLRHDRLSDWLKRYIRETVYRLMRPYWEQQAAFNCTVCNAIADIYRIQSTLTFERADTNISAADPMDTVQESRVFQIVSSLNYGDAVGNEVLVFKRSLQENGYPTEIYANYIHRKIPAGSARFYKDMPTLKEDDIVIYHFASECSISQDVKGFPCKVILRYHNVTPPEFFHGFDSKAEKATATALLQVKEIMPYISGCLPVSEFNMQDLRRMGYTCPMKVLPILIRFEDYEQKPDQEVLKKYSDGVTNILFVGRIAPNKKIEDVIESFACYKKQYDPGTRLFLIGSFQETDKYYQFLKKRIKKLGVEDVIFPGHIPFSAILAYYRAASVFLCLSEHEGFCVPLVEAMYFKVPIVAYDCCAIGSTMGNCGILLKDKSPKQAAAGIKEALENAEHLQQREALQIRKFDKDILMDELARYMKVIERR